ncbi:non-ribosomal peptide synthetase, partial [Aphanothece hegewaldii CCALA 016]
MIESQQTNKNKNIETIYPLSSLQQGLLFHTLMFPDSGMYIEQYSCILEGQLNVEAFDYAWQQVIQRNAVFRTLFAWENLKQPIQVVLKSVNFSVQYQDWQNLSTQEQYIKLQAFLKFDKTQSFDCSKPPLMRCTLIQIKETTYHLIWSFHHLLCDAWSVFLIFKEVFDYYNAFNQEQELILKPAIPYRNYITWLQQQNLQEAETFWRNILKDFTTPTRLSVNKFHQQDADTKLEYKSQSLTLTVEKTQKLITFVRQNRLTLNTLIQGAWSILLSRYTQESDILFGVTVSGRAPSLKGVESIIGLFINTLPFRVKITPNTRLLPWLKQLQILQLEIEQYSYSSLVDIQKWSDIPQSQSLFESILVFENAPIDTSLFNQENGLRIRKIQGISWTNYPLTLTIIPSSELTIDITYNQNNFQDDIIYQMLEHLETLVFAMVAHPEELIIALPILTQAEQEKILNEWNKNNIEYPCECIHQLFEKQAEKNPDAIALVYQKQQLTYSQLNSKANQL